MTMRASGPGAMADGPGEMVASFEKLERELRPLCRGLARSRLSRLAAVSTIVRLPEGTAEELALRWLCEELADEFGVGQTVRRDGDGWAVRFARSLPPEPSRAKGYPVFHPLRAGLALVRIVVGSLRWGLRATSEHGARRDNPAMKREVQ